jgi:hypothetical protein
MWEPGDESPAAGDRTSGAQGSCNGRDHATEAVRTAKPVLQVSWGEGDVITTASFEGREARTLGLLIDCGSRGFTSGEASPLGWAFRCSHYVFKLRGAGLNIETMREKAGDAVVGRYMLRSRVGVISREGC